MDEIREKGEFLVELIDDKTASSNFKQLQDVARAAFLVEKLSDDVARIDLKEFFLMPVVPVVYGANYAGVAEVIELPAVCSSLNDFRSAIESFFVQCGDSVSSKKINTLLKRVQRTAKLIERLGDC